MKRFRIGKSSALKAATKEAESELDVTSIMLAREQVTVHYSVDKWIRMMMDCGERESCQGDKKHAGCKRMKHCDSPSAGEE